MLPRFTFLILVPGIILLVFGLRALNQDRLEIGRQLQDRLDHAAELAARAIDQQLTQWEQFRGDGVTVSLSSLRVSPADKIAYDLAAQPTLEPAQTSGLAAAERDEIQGNWARAIAAYQRFTTSGSPAERAVSIERLARTYAKAGMRDDAVRTYHNLEKTADARIGAVPADLIARFELCSLDAGDKVAFYRDLVAGRWRLDKARYLFYSERARDWVDPSEPARHMERGKLDLAAAVESFVQTGRPNEGSYLAFRGGDNSLIVPAAAMRTRLEKSVALDRELRIRLVEPTAPRRPFAAVRMLSARNTPWVVQAEPIDAVRLFRADNQRRTIYLSMLLLVFLLLVSGTYITARTVRREVEIARLKSEFVSTVSHEFRSPLTAICQLSEMLQRGRVADESKRIQYYELISRESDRLSRLVENLLDFSRMESGRKQYHFEPLDTAEWLRDIASRFRARNISASVPEELPVILADRSALTSAVDNLLDNAIKYSPPGSPVVLEAEVTPSELAIRVRDRGYGIAERDRGRIFDKFYRGSGEISRQVKGAGVGLSLVRQIVDAHGGIVDFDSTVGEGSVFYIRLKLA